MTGPVEREAAKQAVRERIARSRMLWRETLRRPATGAASTNSRAGTGTGEGEAERGRRPRGDAAAEQRVEAGDPQDRPPLDRGGFPRSQTLRWLSAHPAAALAAGLAVGLVLWSGAPRRAAAWARPAAAAAQGALAQTAGTVRRVRAVLAWVKPFLPVLAAVLAARAPAATAGADDEPDRPVRSVGGSAPAGGREPPP